MTEIRGWSSEVVGAGLATVAVLVVALLIRTIAFQRPRRKLPPGPRGWPILGSLLSLGTLPPRSLYELSKQYGPLMFMRLGSVNTVTVTSPHLAHAILKTHDKIMSSRAVQVVATEIFYNGADIGWAPYGQYWRYLRKVCTLGLLTANRISQFREIREREVMAMLHFILEESQRGHAVNLTECFTTLTMNNITQTLMSQSYCVQGSDLKPALTRMSSSLPDLVRETFELLGAFNIGDYVPFLKPFDLQGLHKRSKAMHRELDKFVDEIIEEHRHRRSIANTENCKEDFLDALLGIGQTKEFEQPLSMVSIKAIILDMIVAGGDTSAVTAVWALVELLRHPHVLRKVQEELDSVVGPHRLVQEEDLPKFHYTNAVVKETFRLHPTGSMLFHESSEDCEIEGFHIPARSQVFVNLWGIQRDPAVWERPLEFDPDRFLNCTIDMQGQDFKFLPFGSGRRMCPGMNFGILMVMYPISLLLHALDWALPDGQKPEELDMSESFGLFLRRRLPLTVVGKARLPHHVLYPAHQVK